MGVKVKIGSGLHGDAHETHADGVAVVVSNGHLLVSSSSTALADEVVAVYAPGAWISAVKE